MAFTAKDVQALREKTGVGMMDCKKAELLTTIFLEKPKKAKTNTNTKINTKSNDIESDKPPTHHKYGEYKNVLLSDDEFEKLKADIPDCLQLIEQLSEYMDSTGKKYKSHYATIRSWSRKEKPSGQAESKPIWTVGTVV